jgi:hypothetical protein
MRRSPVICLILLAALAGCGDSDHERVDPEVMLDQASRRAITSANLELDAQLKLVGIERISEPITLRLEGPYVSGGGVRIPSFDWRASASALGFPVGGHLVSTGENVYLTVYGEGYEVGRASVAAANRRLGESVAGGLDLDPRSWLGEARVVGDGNAGGIDCERIAARLRSDVVTRDLEPLATGLGLPEPLAVSGRVTACVGYDDRTLHELELHAGVGIPPADRPSLGGASGALVDATLVIADVGEQEEITAPRGARRPIRDLLLTLSDLGVPVPL